MPGKEEFHETLRYYRRQIELQGVDLRLNTRADAAQLIAGGYDDIVLATGITPRQPAIDGIDHPKVLSYLDVLQAEKPVGEHVAVVGAGGIGFDVSEYLVHHGTSPSIDPPRFNAEWGIDTGYAQAGGLAAPVVEPPARRVHLLQRKTSKVGDGLGKTTGWIHRASLKARGVAMSPGVQYQRIDDAGLHVTVDGKPELLAVDNVVICAGQEPQRELLAALQAAGCRVHLIGGAEVAAELDAKRAIKQGTELAACIESAPPATESEANTAVASVSAAPRYSSASTVRELLGHPPAQAILERYLPGFSAHPQIAMAAGMPLTTVAKFSGGLITDEALQAIDKALQALGDAPATTPAPVSAPAPAAPAEEAPMDLAPTHLHPAAARSLAAWHAMVAKADLSELARIVHPDAVFRSPMAFNPYGPAPALLLALQTVVTILKDFRYHRQFASDDGLNVVLEFSARVGDKRLKGIDIIRFDEQGLITEFEVMIRPLNGLQALGAEMGARLGQQLPGFKTRA